MSADWLGEAGRSSFPVTWAPLTGPGPSHVSLSLCPHPVFMAPPAHQDLLTGRIFPCSALSCRSVAPASPAPEGPRSSPWCGL